ncbi:hypothetical protein D3C84_1002580 [compost metagenome]
MFWERNRTHGVIHAAGGAHPSSCAPSYGFDKQHFDLYCQSAQHPDGWQAYFDAYVRPGEAAYLNKVGGLEAIHRLPLPVF